VKIHPSVPLEEAALFGCAVLTGVGAVVNTAQVRVGASVAVVGLGGVGLAALIGAQAAGARQIIAIDLSDDKLEQARALGATHTVNADRADALEHVSALSSGGVEFAFECAGSIHALDLAYRITRRGGSTVTAGLPPSTALWPLPAVSLVAEERTLKGSYIGTCVPSRDSPRYMELYLQVACRWISCSPAASSGRTRCRQQSRKRIPAEIPLQPAAHAGSCCCRSPAG
jgi:alcohol dehydrogenase